MNNQSRVEVHVFKEYFFQVKVTRRLLILGHACAIRFFLADVPRKLPEAVCKFVTISLFVSLFFIFFFCLLMAEITINLCFKWLSLQCSDSLLTTLKNTVSCVLLIGVWSIYVLDHVNFIVTSLVLLRSLTEISDTKWKPRVIKKSFYFIFVNRESTLCLVRVKFDWSCAVLCCCAVLRCAVLCCVVLFYSYAVLCCSMLCCAVLCYAVLCCVVLYCSVVLCCAMLFAVCCVIFCLFVCLFDCLFFWRKAARRAF